MKKFSVLLTLAVLMVSSSVFAGSIDYLSNQSAKFLMTLTRTASTEASADIANYNPAGTAFLAEGFYIDVSNQTLFKPYETKFNNNLTTAPITVYSKTATTEQDEPTILLPNVYMVYNFGQIGAGNLAAYAHIGISAGGGSLNWEDGTAATNLTLASKIFGAPVTSNSFEVSSVYYTAHVGAAYAFLDNMISVSLGGKAIMPKRSLKIEGTTATQNLSGEYEYEAKGYTPVIGLDIKPIKDLTIAARYEHETKLEFEYNQKELTGTGVASAFLGALAGQNCTTLAGTTLASIGIADGAKTNYNLPAMIGLGAEYQVNPELQVMTSANIYLLSQADLGKVYTANPAYGLAVFTKSNEEDLNKFFGTGYEVSIGTKYLVMPELKVGIGFIYTESGAKDKYFNDDRTFLNCAGNPPLDSWTIGLGGTYTVIENLDLTLSGSWTHYLPEKYNWAIMSSGAQVGTASGEYKKDVYNIGIGAGYKI